jgi:two-component system sensor histidine kinase DctS
MFADVARRSGENIESEHDRAQIRDLLRKIATEADRANKVVKSVREFVRRGDPVHESVRVQDLAEAILPQLENDARKNACQLLLDIDDPALTVVCERLLIERVIINLATNGMQAMSTSTPSESRRLRIDIGADASGRVKFDVSDTGPGVPAWVSEQIDTPFKKSTSNGMGLGLSFCRSVIERHGGVLTHRSVPSNDQPGLFVGAEFSFSLNAAPRPHGKPGHE